MPGAGDRLCNDGSALISIRGPGTMCIQYVRVRRTVVVLRSCFFFRPAPSLNYNLSLFSLKSKAVFRAVSSLNYYNFFDTSQERPAPSPAQHRLRIEPFWSALEFPDDKIGSAFRFKILSSCNILIWIHH